MSSICAEIANDNEEYEKACKYFKIDRTDRPNCYSDKGKLIVSAYRRAFSMFGANEESHENTSITIPPVEPFNNVLDPLHVSIKSLKMTIRAMKKGEENKFVRKELKKCLSSLKGCQKILKGIPGGKQSFPFYE